MIADLLGALNAYPQLSKVSASALAELGNAIGDSGTKAEIAALLEGTLVEEVHIRHACLQAVQVSAPAHRPDPWEFVWLMWAMCYSRSI
jgi:hypothetical protein